MIPGIDENFDRACRHVALVVVTVLVSFTLGMWVMRDTVLPSFFLASTLSVVVLGADAAVRLRTRRSTT